MGVVVVCSIYTTSSMNTILLLLLCWMQTHRSLKSIAIIFSLSLCRARALVVNHLLFLSVSVIRMLKRREEEEKKHFFFSTQWKLFHFIEETMNTNRLIKHSDQISERTFFSNPLGSVEKIQLLSSRKQSREYMSILCLN